MASQNLFNTPAEFQSASMAKRRRYVPTSISEFVSNIDGTEIETDIPLILQLCDKAPSQREIEEQLLQVGMRIRKAIPEGYKFTPRPFFNMHRLSPATQAALCGGDSAGGLHNVGGLAMQPISTATFCGINLASLSHISTPPIQEQKMWSYSTSHKRGYEGDSDSDDQEFLPQTPTLGADSTMAIPVDYFNIELDNMGDVSPFTQANEIVQPQFSGRRLAKPRSRRVLQPVVEPVNSYNPFANLTMPQPPQNNGTRWMGHKRMTSCGVEASMMMNMNDFGEASFLRRREDVDMDCS